MENISDIIKLPTNERCVLNVSRQIGTTTALCQYALDMAMEGKTVLYYTDRYVSCNDVFEKMRKLVSETATDKTIQIRAKERMIKIIDVGTNGAIEVTHCNRGHIPSLKRADIHIVDNADFFSGWEPFIENITHYTKVIIASCPSRFTGHWPLFKKLCVKDQHMWKVFNLKREYDDKFRQCMSSQDYDMECNNYESFFDTAKKIHENIGDLLFIENHPFYERVGADK